MHNYILLFLVFTSFVHPMEYKEENEELVISWHDRKEPCLPTVSETPNKIQKNSITMASQKKDTVCHEENCFMCIHSKQFSTAKPNMLPFDSKTIYANASYEAYFRTLCSCTALLKGSTLDKLKQQLTLI